MRKTTFLFAMLILTMVCAVFSCKKNDDTTDVSAKFLTVSQFESSVWNGIDSKGDEVTLKVSSTTNMTLTYYTSISKRTDDKNLKTVEIAYTFDEIQGSFSGTGDDGKTYLGSLLSFTTLTLNAPFGSVSMTKK